MWQRWQGFNDSFNVGNLQGPHCMLNIFENNSQMRKIAIPESQAKTFSYSHLPVVMTGCKTGLFISLMTNSGGVLISNPGPPDLKALDHHTSRLHQQNAVTTDVIMSSIAQIGRRVWPRRVKTDLLWAIPLVSAGRDSKLRFEGHTRSTCSLMLQLNVCFLGIC